YRWILGHKRLVRAVVISKGLLDDMHLVFAREASRVKWLVAHDGANGRYDVPSFPLRRSGELQIGYAGGLRSGNGMALILELARRLPNCTFHLLGGHPAEVK